MQLNSNNDQMELSNYPFFRHIVTVQVHVHVHVLPAGDDAVKVGQLCGCI